MKCCNVLIVAHEFSPYQGSECSVGWNLVLELAKYHKITVIYAASNQFATSNYENDVNDYFKTNPQTKNLKLIAIPQTYWGNIIIKINQLLSNKKSSIGIPFLYFLAYNFWQKAVHNFVAKNININQINLIHQLTSISFREPGYLWRFEKPFVWGPISGNVKIPHGFLGLLSFRQRLFQFLRSLSIDLQLIFSKRIRKASHGSKKIYCVTKEDYNHFKKYYPDKVSQMLDVGGYSSSEVKRRKLNRSKYNFLWVGRIDSSKALELFLYSIKKIQSIPVKNEVEFTIIGDGPELKKNLDLAKKLELKNINWLGYIPHDKVFYNLSMASALVHTSIREATSAIILESMSLGIPVICHDAFGMSIAVDERSGIKIPFVDIKASVDGFSSSMIKLMTNNKLLEDLSINALKRSRELTWENMALQISADYQKINNQS
jgi:glycosyltransferase involved in cell wall biosynthesis